MQRTVTSHGIHHLLILLYYSVIKSCTIIFSSELTQTSILPTAHKPGVKLGCLQLEEADHKHSYLEKVKTFEYYI